MLLYLFTSNSDICCRLFYGGTCTLIFPSKFGFVCQTETIVAGLLKSVLPYSPSNVCFVFLQVRSANIFIYINVVSAFWVLGLLEDVYVLLST